MEKMQEFVRSVALYKYWLCVYHTCAVHDDNVESFTGTSGSLQVRTTIESRMIKPRRSPWKSRD